MMHPQHARYESGALGKSPPLTQDLWELKYRDALSSGLKKLCVCKCRLVKAPIRTGLRDGTRPTFTVGLHTVYRDDLIQQTAALLSLNGLHPPRASVPRLCSAPPAPRPATAASPGTHLRVPSGFSMTTALVCPRTKPGIQPSAAGHWSVAARNTRNMFC